MNNYFISIRAKSPVKKLTQRNSPTVLYHASPVGDLNMLLPHAKTVRDENEGPVVFATPDFSYATIFLMPTDDSWVKIIALNNIYCVVIADEKKFKNQDVGGSIYSLPVTDFYCDLTKSGREKEWVCKKPVVPINTTTFSSSLYAMMEHLVQVYFVNKKVFVNISNSKDLGLSILRNLKSENEKQGINYIKI